MFARVVAPLALVLFAAAPVQAAEPTAVIPAVPWPHEAGDLPPDPAIAWGRLPNGLHYAVRANAEPRARISLCLLVDAGSRLERDDQRGYAHFVEHLAFAGTRRFPAGTLIQTLQRHGMAFGAEVSAFTNLTSTFYLLNLAGNNEASLDEGLRVLRDFADGIEFAPEQIRKERGVILSEKRTRESGPERVSWARFAAVYASTLLPQRHPIGEVAVLERAEPAGLREFYDTWYRPERMVLIAVGDTTTGMLATQIERQFADFRPRRPAVPEPDWGATRTVDGVRAALFTEAESGGGISTEVVCVQLGVLPSTRAGLRTGLARATACDILTLRLQAEVKQDATSFGGAAAAYGETVGAFTEASVQIQSRSVNWRRALNTVEHELRRALRHGFYPSEIALSKSTGAAALRYAVERASTRQSPELVQELLGDLVADRVTQTPAEHLALAEPMLASLTPEECTAALRGLWTDDHRVVLVSGALTLADPAREIAEIYDLSRSMPLASADEKEEGKFAYTQFGPPGTVFSREHVADLDLDLVRFDNGICLNVKKTNYEAGTVALRMRLGGGLSTEPANRPGLGIMTGASFVGMGLGRHDLQAISRLTRGTTANLSFGVEDDAFVFWGGSDPKDLRVSLQLIAAYLTDPGWREDGWKGAVGAVGTQYVTVGSDAAALAQAIAPHIITNGDPRYGLPRYDDVDRRTPREVRDWLDPQLKSGPIEIGIVGDVEVDAVIAAVAETLGALPSRPLRNTLRCRAVNPPRKAAAMEATVASKTPKTSLWMGWIVPGVEDPTVSRRAEILADVLGDRARVKIREELGATYDVAANFAGSRADPRFGYVFVQLTAKPAEAKRLARIVLDLSDQLAKGGVTDDEFERARQPVIASLEQHLRNNGYWLYYVLAEAQERPARLAWPRTRNRDYETMTARDISALAGRCLGARNAFSCTTHPK